MKHSKFTRSACLMTATLAASLSTTHLATADETDVRSPEQIRAVIDGLQKTDVAWREVQWKTCLIEGLAESRRTGKPMVLWIFIDRPIDDERC